MDPPKVGVVIGWLLAMALCMLAVYGNYNRGDCEGCKPWSGWFASAYYVSYKDLFSLGIAWLMFACCTGYGGKINTLNYWLNYDEL